MPDELTDFAKKLITRCPALINLFAEKINSIICNWDVEEALEPITCRNNAFIAINQEPVDIQDLISHVGYSEEQCGYGEWGK